MHFLVKTDAVIKDIKKYIRFFYKQHFKSFINNGRLKLAKNQTNAKQHVEAELLLFENYSHSSFTLSKNSGTYSKK